MAVDRYTKGIALDASSSKLYANRSAAHLKLQDGAAALEAKTSLPTDTPALTHRGR